MLKLQFYVYSVIFLILDLLSKYLVLTYKPELVHFNTGIAFSIMTPDWLPIVLAVSVVILIFGMVYKQLIQFNWIWSLFVAGSVGNLIDRLYRGAVVDFIQIGNFPVFNLADIYISIASIAIVYFYILNNKENV